jgi:hypothetical protein
MDFDDAWVKAHRQIVWPANTQPRREWKVALKDCRSAWEACYHDEGTRLNISTLVMILERQPREIETRNELVA